MPQRELVSSITHVALAFMRSEIFNVEGPTEWPLFTTVDAVRSHFSEGTAIMIAVGGWGDTDGFSKAAATDDSRKLFASNIKAMVEDTGADGKTLEPYAWLDVERANRCRYRLGISRVSLVKDMQSHDSVKGVRTDPIQRERRGLQTDPEFGKTMGDGSLPKATRRDSTSSRS